MKAYKIELLIIDHDEIGAEGIIIELENTKYSNRCINSEVKKVVEKDIGNWHDNHPFNFKDKSTEEYERLFNEK